MVDRIVDGTGGFRGSRAIRGRRAPEPSESTQFVGIGSTGRS